MTMTQTTNTKMKRVTSNQLESLPSNPFAFEVLQLASKQRSRAKKVEVLQKYAHDSIKAVLIWNYDDSIISVLPEGDVPYNSYGDDATQGGTLSDKIKDQVDALDRASTSSLGSTDDSKGRIRSSLRKEWTKLYNFVKGGNDSLSQLRRETMFINILELLHPKDAEILVLVKDKRLTEKYNIPFPVVQEAYPDIKWGGRS
jgi:hypothetical protein